MSAPLCELDATFDRFVEMLRDRLAQGARDYGDRPLDLPPAELLACGARAWRSRLR